MKLLVNHQGFSTHSSDAIAFSNDDYDGGVLLLLLKPKDHPRRNNGVLKRPFHWLNVC